MDAGSVEDLDAEDIAHARNDLLIQQGFADLFLGMLQQPTQKLLGRKIGPERIGTQIPPPWILLEFREGEQLHDWSREEDAFVRTSGEDHPRLFPWLVPGLSLSINPNRPPHHEVDQKDSLIFEVEAQLLAVRLDSFDMGSSKRGLRCLSFRRPNSIRTSFSSRTFCKRFA